MRHHLGTKIRRPKMVLVLFLFFTLEGLETLIGMIGTVVRIGLQLAAYFKKSGGRRKKSRHRRKQIK
jgi:hypothetical protein